MRTHKWIPCSKNENFTKWIMCVVEVCWGQTCWAHFLSHNLQIRCFWTCSIVPYLYPCFLAFSLSVEHCYVSLCITAASRLAEQCDTSGRNLHRVACVHVCVHIGTELLITCKMTKLFFIRSGIINPESLFSFSKELNITSPPAPNWLDKLKSSSWNVWPPKVCGRWMFCAVSSLLMDLLCSMILSFG